MSESGLFDAPAPQARTLAIGSATRLMALSVLRLAARQELWYLPASDEWMVNCDPVSESVQPIVDDLRDAGLIDADGQITDAGQEATR